MCICVFYARCPLCLTFFLVPFLFYFILFYYFLYGPRDDKDSASLLKGLGEYVPSESADAGEDGAGSEYDDEEEGPPSRKKKKTAKTNNKGGKKGKSGAKGKGKAKR